MVSCNVHIESILRVVLRAAESAGVSELMREVNRLQVVLAISPIGAILHTERAGETALV